MTVVALGTITLHTGEEVKGLAIEATKEELQKMGNLLYQQVSVVPAGGGENVRTPA